MTVENTQVIDTGGATEAPMSNETAAQAVDTADMEAAWAQIHLPENVDRAEDGKFVSKNPTEEVAATETAELEGAAQGEATEGQSTVPDVPLPSNLYGLDAEWASLPAETRQKFAERSNELNNRMSDMGRQVAQSKSLIEAASEFAEYFNGNIAGPDGNHIDAANGLRYLANIQRQMDQSPVDTLLSIADTYNIRQQVAQRLGIQGQQPTQQPPPQPSIDPRRLAEIARTEARQEAARIAQEESIKALNMKGQALVDGDADIKAFSLNSPQRWQAFVTEGIARLGENASLEAVFKYAKDQATEADPTLRSKRDAAGKAAIDKAAKAEAAKRAAGVNVTSTSTGKPRPVTDDQAMEAVWNQMHGSA